MAKIEEMTLEERETHISLSAAARAEEQGWDVFSDDPVMIARLEKLGLEAYRVTRGGGKFFTIPQNQITIRRRREITAEQREELSRRAKENFGKARD